MVERSPLRPENMRHQVRSYTKQKSVENENSGNKESVQRETNGNNKSIFSDEERARARKKMNNYWGKRKQRKYPKEVVRVA